MKPSQQASYIYQQEGMAEENQGALAVGMDVDAEDSDPVDVLGADFERQPVDSDFFNSFEDDFDDSDIA